MYICTYTHKLKYMHTFTYTHLITLGKDQKQADKDTADIVYILKILRKYLK